MDFIFSNFRKGVEQSLRNNGIDKKRHFKISAIVVCLLVSMMSILPNDTHADEVIRLGKSSTDKGISFTIDDFFYNGNKLVIDYTVESKTAQKIDETHPNLLEKLDVSINGKPINSISYQGHQKVAKNKYRGVIEINPPEGTPDHFALKFNTDSIFDQEGQWTIDFPVNKSTEIFFYHFLI
ncbi:DUF4179 domain-containing protein [Priestia filamentosa]|uniref:DUF4179 domain-containing protein n=1 Tax=Priestia filamentosa TaxID=1402861 RepID=UPI003F160570